MAGLYFTFFPLFQTQNSSINYLTGHKNPYRDLPNSMHPEAYNSFLQMKKCALENGVDISIVSGYRSFDRQLLIWNNKYKRFKKQFNSDIKALENVTSYSAIPGTSRHHWGTEIDIIDANAKQPRKGLLNTINFGKDGNYNKLNLWMKANAHQFGFHLVYTDDKCRTGFKFEPWHYSYSPISNNLLKDYSKLNLVESVKNDKIRGISHFDKESLLTYYKTHLCGINPALLS